MTSRPLQYLAYAFAVALAVSVAGAQIVAVLLLIAAATLLPGRWQEREVRWALGLALFYIVPLLLIGGAHDGWRGAGESLRHTWMCLLLPAAAILRPRLDRYAFCRFWLFALLFAAFAFLVQYDVVGLWLSYRRGAPEEAYNSVWRYGFHRAPYISSLLFLLPSFILVTAEKLSGRGAALWLVFATAIVALNARGVIIAWAVTTGLLLLLPECRSILRRPAVLLAALLVLAVFVFAFFSRWNPFAEASQTSSEDRLVIWSQAIAEIEERPVFGHGFERFHPNPSRVRPQYRHYLETQSNPHNGYLMIAHAAGLAGYAVLWVTMGGIFMQLWRARSQGDRLALANAAGLIALALAALTDKSFFTTLPMLQFWFSAGLALPREETA